MKKYRTQYELMTTVPVPKLIMKLGIPTMISMFVTSIYNMADSYFVGRINTSASSATGVVLGLMAILQAMGFMFGHGSGSIISRKHRDCQEILCYRLLFSAVLRICDPHSWNHFLNAAHVAPGQHADKH